MNAASTARSLRNIEHVIPLSSHRASKSACNDTNGMKKMVVPLWEQNAGNMNIKLFLAPNNMGLIEAARENHTYEAQGGNGEQ